MRISVRAIGMEALAYQPLAVLADKLGYDVFWIGDHIVYPETITSWCPHTPDHKPPHESHAPLSNVWVTIGYLAALTKRIKLGPGVFVLPLRNPFNTAQEVATAQNLSQGRVILGIGTGWMKEEFDLCGERFDGRGSRTDEILDILAKLWTGEVVEHHGRWYDFPPLRFVGIPREQVPIVVGSMSGPGLRRAAERGDGWNGTPAPLEYSVKIREQIERMREAAGRADRPFKYYVRLSGPFTVDNIRRHEDAGLEDILVTTEFVDGAVSADPGAVLPLTLQQRLDGLQRMAEIMNQAGHPMG